MLFQEFRMRKLTLSMVSITLIINLSACQQGISIPKVASQINKTKATPQTPATIAGTKKTGPVQGNKWMIAVANPYAAEAGLKILRQGGSATDAAIAAQLVLNLVEPQSSGIGGGAFLMHLDGISSEISTYDGREKAPATASPEMFMNEDGTPKKFFDAVVGGLSVGVPGVLRMLENAHKENGRLQWAKLFQPAIELAEKGFVVSPRLNRLIKKDKYLRVFATTEAYFHNNQGTALKVGHVLKNQPFAKTLRLIAQNGADAFYTGTLAQRIVDTVNGASKNPGGLSMADMASYTSEKRDPVCLFYRQWLICGMGPPSSGGLTTLQILGILQSFDLPAMKPDEDGQIDLGAAHLIAESSKLAFADRNTYIADEDFITVPSAGMLDPSYLELRAREISPKKALKKAFPGNPSLNQSWNFAPGDDSRGLSTTHFSIIDGEGNAVSMTSSIENTFGSRMMVGGFLINSQLTDFSFISKKNGKLVANHAAPGKRPRSSMSPTLVIDTNGKTVLAIGSPGGAHIIGYVAQTIIAALDWDMDIQSAVDMPHIINLNGATILEADTKLDKVIPAMEALGHTLKLRAMTSGLHGIRVRDGRLYGGADRRREGVALSD
jgi:gamma-glutamyltranspeptidase/glutathione hydrolase